MADTSEDDWTEVLQWHFAVVGLDIGQESFEIADGIAIRRIKQLPTAETISNCLSNHVASGLFRHYADLGMLRFELVIDLEYMDEDIEVHDLADLIVTSIGARTQSDLFCLTACEQSWGQLNNNPDQQYMATIENSPYVASLDAPVSITDDELQWVQENLDSVLELRTLPPFEIAFKSYSTQMHCPNPRMAATQTWAGIESLIQGKVQASYSLSLLIALLETVLKPKKGGNRYNSRGPTNFHGMELQRCRKRIIPAA